MTAPSAMRVGILGCGKMGAAMVARLASLGHSVVIWNRSPSAAETVAAECASFRGTVVVAPTPRDLLDSLAPKDSIAIFILSKTVNVTAVLEEGAWHAEAWRRGVAVCNITSGSPTEGRDVAKLVASPHNFVDGAYCGPPAKVRQGQGQLFLSSDGGSEAVDAFADVLGAIGDCCFCGHVGAARALDYAVVDLAFVNYASYCANAAMLEKEGVSTEMFAREAAKRLNATPHSIELAAARMQSREGYDVAPVATLATWRNFWASRLPYFREHGFPTHFPDMILGLLDAAGASSERSGDDVTRLQEVLRYGTSSTSSEEEPSSPPVTRG